MKTILAADIGGTKTSLSLIQICESENSVIEKKHYPSSDFSSFEEILDSFLSNAPQITSACFAVAGPVTRIKQHHTASVTNLPWRLDNLVLNDKYKFGQSHLINDFQAIGHALKSLSPNDLLVLQDGEPQPQGNRAILGAGTGLGESILIPCNNDYKIVATEGGHVDFAPTTAFEAALLQFLSQSFTHVSYERILSGEGILSLFNFFLHIHGENQDDFKHVIHASDPAALISKMAMQQKVS